MFYSDDPQAPSGFLTVDACSEDVAHLSLGFAVDADTAARCRTADGRYLSSFNDVTAQREAETPAVESARTDPLTGLTNRRVLMDALTSALLPIAAAIDGIIVDLAHRHSQPKQPEEQAS